METTILNFIEIANNSYLTGKPLEKDYHIEFTDPTTKELFVFDFKTGDFIDDFIYDQLIDMIKKIKPEFKSKTRIGYENQSERKVKLPHILPSLVKKTSFDDFGEWVKDKSKFYDVIVTPKYDGVSCIADIQSEKAFTGGGHSEYGTNIDKHFCFINHNFSNVFDSTYFIGEIIFKKSSFQKHSKICGGKYKNARNAAAGKMNDLESDFSVLSDMFFVSYNHIDNLNQFAYKSEIIDYLNQNQNDKIGSSVPYFILSPKDITEDKLNDIFYDWKKNLDFDLDGLVIEINDIQYRENTVGYNSNGEPNYAVAYKGNFEDESETTIIDIVYQTSKFGIMKPVIKINPIDLNGATISNVFADNARWMMVYGIGIGSKIKVKRSGMIIPRISEVEGIKVLKADELIQIYDKFNSDIQKIREYLGIKINNFKDIKDVDFDGVEYISKNNINEIQHQKLVAFFEILEIDGVSDGVVSEFINNGYSELKDILQLQSDEISKWDGWGKSRAENIINAINKKISNIDLEKLQHASSLFKGLGSKKLALLKHFTSKPTIEEICEIDGFDIKSANVYIDNIDEFWKWASELPIILSKTKEIKIIGEKCKGWGVCFTGVRSKEMEDKIIANGGEIKSGVSKNTTHLIMKERGSGSNKEKKALEFGTKIFTLKEFETYINNIENGLF